VWVVAGLGLLVGGWPAGGAELESARQELVAAARAYDAEAATAVLAGLRRPLEEETADGLALRVEAGLVVAEVLRVTYEQTPQGERAGRRLLGQRIDAAAEEALTLVDRLPETSERERMRADLLATLIRSDYRAQKHDDAFQAAVARARELDPDNPRALVTAAKPLLFADAAHGGDPAAALRLLDRALELAPGLESAVLLRALALDTVGDQQAALAAWRRALERNPLCRPARWRLERARAED
jgi:tetratricopeptide (TPR) repeat protein